MNVTQEDVTASITQIMEDIVQDWDLDLDGGVSTQSRLVADLDFSSVDFVEMAVAIEDRFKGVDLAFDELIMVDGRRVDDLTIGEVSEFVLAKLKG